jgi:hypothetical protein
MKTALGTVFLMAAGVVLFLASVIIVVALVVVAHARKGKVGQYRISITREDGRGPAPGPELEFTADLREVEKAVHKVDDRVKDVGREIKRFLDRSGEKIHSARKHLKRSRAHMEEMDRRVGEDPAGKHALKAADKALVKREIILQKLGDLREKMERTQAELEVNASKLQTSLRDVYRSCRDRVFPPQRPRPQPLEKAKAEPSPASSSEEGGEQPGGAEEEEEEEEEEDPSGSAGPGTPSRSDRGEEMPGRGVLDDPDEEF